MPDKHVRRIGLGSPYAWRYGAPEWKVLQEGRQIFLGGFLSLSGFQLGARLKASFRVMVWRIDCIFMVDRGVPRSLCSNDTPNTHETFHWYALGFNGNNGLCW